MSIVEKAVWIIERNNRGRLSVDQIAEGCGVSRSHLASAFASTGTSVMKYLRSRRLTDAALALSEGAPDILNLALDTGYGSHEAFTRAFKDQFGATPEGVRDRQSTEGLALVAPLRLKPKDMPRLPAPRFVKQGVTRVVGLVEQCSFDTSISIPGQWQRFMEQVEGIDNVIPGMPTGINRAADEEGWFPYMAAVEVSAFGAVPKSLTQLEIPARTYAVFEHNRHVSTIFDTYSAIWDEALPATGRKAADAPILEKHNHAFDPETGEGGLTLWIPLEEV